MLLRIVSGLSLFPLLLHVSAQADYDFDCSFAIHNRELKCGDILQHRQTFYNKYIEGCKEHYGVNASLCDSNEDVRLARNMRQPQSMVNYTSTGYKKIRAPERLRRMLSKHWEINKDIQKEETWDTGDIYVNHWEKPTYMVSVEDQDLEGTGGLKNMVWAAAKETIEEWTGFQLRPTSLFGIRVYKEGAVLSPHVDRLPLVSSCIVNVAQDVDEPWPLEVYNRQGKAVNITMEPGDMVLYESHSLIHGRPFPLKGRYYANIFIHFEPTGRLVGDESDDYESFLPPYIVPGSPEVPNWIEKHPYGWDKEAPPTIAVNTLPGHLAAHEGDVGKLAKIYVENKEALTSEDENGWQPIHEAAFSGHIAALQVLIGFGADINARTHFGEGSTPLNLALSLLDQGAEAHHVVVDYMRKNGAIDLGPEL